MRMAAFWHRSGGEESPWGGYRINVWPAGTLGKNAEKGDPLHFTHHEKDQCSAGQ